MQTAAKSVPLFTAGRFFGGLGVGGNSCIIPIYLAEWFVHFSIQNQADPLMVLSKFAQEVSWSRHRHISMGHYHWTSPCSNSHKFDAG